MSKFGYNISKKVIIDKSNDPIWVASKILDVNKVNIIVDAGASISDITLNLTEVFPNSVIHAFEPFPEFLKLRWKIRD